ncbi:MAG: peroxiredoxin [Dokdonella sp.]|nr:MAG: peroxiredoxin [Dokdonella sp.]
MPDPALAPIALPATSGQTFTLAAHHGHPVVLYFYPRDNTPGCTNEAQQFSELHADFVKAGAVVFGVSRDSVKSHENFKAKYELPFELVSDSEEKLCQQLAVIKMKSMYGKQVRGVERSTFVLDRNGEICAEWRGVRVAGHARIVLDVVRRL